MNSFNAQSLLGFLCLLHAGGGDDSVAMNIQYFGQRLPHRCLIIDDQYSWSREVIATAGSFTLL
jgi:hypothetical protein